MFPVADWPKPQRRHRKTWSCRLCIGLTLNGWPRVWRHVPRIARNYWDFWDELSIEGDLLMKGERIVIPTSCRDSILANLHRSHEGVNRSLSLVRTCVYWPGMEADVMDYIRRCVTCIDNAKIPVETLHPHDVPARTMDQNRYEFLPRWFRTEIFNRCRLFLQVSIHLSCHIDSPPKDTEILARSVFDQRHANSHHDRQWTTLQRRRIPDVSRESLTSSTRCPHCTSISQMDSLRWWSRKSRPHTRKWMDLRMLKREPYFSYATPRSQKIYHPWQKFYMDGPHKELSCPDDTDPSTSRESADNFLRYKTRRKNTSTELTEPRMRESWKWENKSDSFCRSSTVQN